MELLFPDAHMFATLMGYTTNTSGSFRLKPLLTGIGDPPRDCATTGDASNLVQVRKSDMLIIHG